MSKVLDDIVINGVHPYGRWISPHKAIFDEPIPTSLNGSLIIGIEIQGVTMRYIRYDGHRTKRCIKCLKLVPKLGFRRKIARYKTTIEFSSCNKCVSNKKNKRSTTKTEDYLQ